jgi:hypothetical protein
MKKEIYILLLGACLASPILAQDGSDDLASSALVTSTFAQSTLQVPDFDDDGCGSQIEGGALTTALSVESDNWLDPVGEDAKPATPPAPKEPDLKSSDDDWSTDEEGQDRISAIKGKKKKPKDGGLQDAQDEFANLSVSEIIPTPAQPSKSTIALNPDEDLYGTSEDANAAVNDEKATETRSDEL